jgi:hypothetical protein
MSKCPGTGTSAKNVTRAWIGNDLPMVGECQTCFQQVRISVKWTVLTHRLR